MDFFFSITHYLQPLSLNFVHFYYPAHATMFSRKTSLGQCLCTARLTPWYYSPPAELFPDSKSCTRADLWANGLYTMSLRTRRHTRSPTVLWHCKGNSFTWTLRIKLDKRSNTENTEKGKLVVRGTVQKKQRKSVLMHKHSAPHLGNSLKENGMLIFWVAVRKSLISGQRLTHTTRQLWIDFFPQTSY